MTFNISVRELSFGKLASWPRVTSKASDQTTYAFLLLNKAAVSIEKGDKENKDYWT